MSDILAKLIWALLIGFIIFLFIKKFQAKKQFEGKMLEYDPNWYQNSLEKYYDSSRKKTYYFHYDKNTLSQGHLMEDRNHKIVYEAKFLYNNVTAPDEVDFVNHVINYTHHHKVGHTCTSRHGIGNFSHQINSTFTFDGEDIFTYLNRLGYNFNFNIEGLAYSIDIIKDGNFVAKLYSSNNGKNYFEADGPIVAKMGGRGLLVVECCDQDLDAAFLYALAFARTE